MVIGHERVSDWLVLFSIPETAVPETSFEAAVAALDDDTLSGMISVIGHDGFPHLTFEQLEAINAAFLPHDYPCAVITAHRSTRAVIRAYEMMGARASAFSSERIDEAFDWLDVPADQRASLLETVAKLRGKLGAD